MEGVATEAGKTLLQYGGPFGALFLLTIIACAYLFIEFKRSTNARIEDHKGFMAVADGWKQVLNANTETLRATTIALEGRTRAMEEMSRTLSDFMYKFEELSKRMASVEGAMNYREMRRWENKPEKP